MTSLYVKSLVSGMKDQLNRAGSWLHNASILDCMECWTDYDFADILHFCAEVFSFKDLGRSFVLYVIIDFVINDCVNIKKQINRKMFLN